MSRMDNLCRAWTRMSVLDNAFGLMDSLRVRINGCTWRIPVRKTVKTFGNVEDVLKYQGVRS
jgi:hypothetical protein